MEDNKEQKQLGVYKTSKTTWIILGLVLLLIIIIFFMMKGGKKTEGTTEGSEGAVAGATAGVQTPSAN